MIPTSLKRRIFAAGGAGAIAIAGVLVAHFEPGRDRGRPYIDPAGVLTVCDGHTGPDIDPSRIYTDAECDAWRETDLAQADAAIQRLVIVPLNDWQRAALIDFVYNVGAGNLAKSTLLRRLNAGDYDGACNEYRRWVYAGGRRLPGLVTRREVDAWVCRQQ